VVTVVALASCGRIGFDAFAEGAPVVAADDIVAWYEMTDTEVAAR
jgi:hypothetical protein